MADNSFSYVPMTREFRYPTVMFADLVDSSGLARELGPEDYREVLTVLYELSTAIIERFGGRVSAELGDGVLAVFGYPYAYEDDAARAVGAALELQAAIASCSERVRTRVVGFDRVLQSRIAIDTGIVLVEALASGSRGAIKVTGDPVNTAAHLQGIATPNSVLITDATRRLVADRFNLEPLGYKEIGRASGAVAVETFQVICSQSDTIRHDAGRRGELTPFIGRQHELAHIVDRWERVVNGEGQLVVVGGDPGIGKSRLLAAARRRLDQGNGWINLRGSEYHQSTVLHPVLELLDRRVIKGATGIEARRRLERDLDVPGSGDREPARLLGALLSLPELDDAPPTSLPPDQQRRKALTALAEWFLRLAIHTPVAIAFEDLQWADPTSIELLRILVNSVGDRRLLLLLTYRTPFEPPWLSQANELRLMLHALTRSEARQLVQSIAQHNSPPEDVMREVLAKSDGVPLFLEEVTRMFVDTPAGMRSVPESLEQLLSARLDRIPVPARETIRLGAVLGRHFSRELLFAVSPKGVEAVEADVATLLELGFIIPDSDGYSFRHVLLRDAAYKRWVRASRVDLHLKVAATLVDRFPSVAETQPEILAYHFNEAGATESAYREWNRAGQRALRNGAYAEAVHHLQRALALHEKLPRPAEIEHTAHTQDELRLRRDFGIALIATQGYTSKAVADNYRRALRRSSELNTSKEEIPLHVLYGLWGTYLVRGDRKATDELACHFRRVETSNDPLARHVAHSTLGALAFYQGNYANALTQCEKAMALYEPVQHFVLMRDYGYEGGLYSHGYVACVLCFTGYPDRGLVVVQQALDLSESIGDPYTKAVSLGFAACLARERREPWRAKKFADDLVRLATDHQFVLYLGIAHCLHGWCTLAEGDLKRGTEEITLGLKIWEKTGARLPGTYFRLNLIEAHLAARRFKAGLALVERGLRQCRTTLESYQEPEYHRLKGELLNGVGDTEAAEREIRSAVESARLQGATWIELRAALSLARLANADHRRPDLLVPLGEARLRLREDSDTPEMREARRLLLAAS